MGQIIFLQSAQLKLKFHKYKIIDMRMSEELKEIIEKLPPDLQKEVKDFVEFLVEKI